MSKADVKKRVIEYLIEELKVPENMIEEDVALSEYEENIEGTIDITIVVEDEEESLVPLMVIQCIDDQVELNEQEIDKHMDLLENIDAATNVGRMILTNGDQMMYADWNGKELQEDDVLPTYEELVKDFKETEKEYMEYMAEHPEHICDEHCNHEHCDHDDCDC